MEELNKEIAQAIKNNLIDLNKDITYAIKIAFKYINAYRGVVDLEENELVDYTDDLLTLSNLIHKYIKNLSWLKV